MAAFLSLPQETLDQILDYVVATRLEGPHQTTSEHDVTEDPLEAPPPTSRLTAIPTLLVSKYLHTCTMLAIKRLKDRKSISLDMLLTWEGKWISSWTYYPSSSEPEIEELRITVRNNGGCWQHRHPAICEALSRKKLDNGITPEDDCTTGKPFKGHLGWHFARIIYAITKRGQVPRVGLLEGSPKYANEKNFWIKKLVVDVVGPPIPRPEYKWNAAALPTLDERWIAQIWKNVALEVVTICQQTLFKGMFSSGSNIAHQQNLLEKVGSIEVLVHGELGAVEDPGQLLLDNLRGIDDWYRPGMTDEHLEYQLADTLQLRRDRKLIGPRNHKQLLDRISDLEAIRADELEVELEPELSEEMEEEKSEDEQEGDTEPEKHVSFGNVEEFDPEDEHLQGDAGNAALGEGSIGGSLDLEA